MFILFIKNKIKLNFRIIYLEVKLIKLGNFDIIIFYDMGSIFINNREKKKKGGVVSEKF